MSEKRRGGWKLNRPSKTYEWLLDHVNYRSDECLLWPFSVAETGYTRIGIPGSRRSIAAHREMCKLAHGEPPTSTHQAAHNCGNRTCVNPRHLRWATPAENVADKLVHGTHARGERSCRTRLTWAEAEQIRIEALRRERSEAEIGRDYGVSRSVVADIKHGRTWKRDWLPSESPAHPVNGGR